MSLRLYINGRFLSQTITGVQRFATEVVAGLDRLALSGGMPIMQILAPAGDPASVAPRPNYHCFPVRREGHLTGHAWEQTELPVRVRNGFLLNLGNSAPVLVGPSQVVVIHDAGVFDTPETYSWRFRIWYKTLWRLLKQTGAHIVTVSNFSRGRISKRLGINLDRIHVMREGGDHMLRFSASSEILAKHALEPGGFVLAVGSRVPHKNFDSLADLAAMLERRGMILAIAGSIEKTVFRSAESRLGPAVRTLGRVSDSELRALYEAATCLVLPTRYEGFGLPAVEAMTCNCPVLTSGAGAVREICGEAALYFDMARPASVTESVEQILYQPDLASVLRARGKSRVETFSWANAAQDLAGIIQSATM